MPASKSIRSASCPSKRLAIFFDGTSATAKRRTNVRRLYDLVAKRDAHGKPQLTCYVPGVGTSTGRRLIGGIFGSGVARNIRTAYEWLVKNYEDGSEIYVYGFSRGAFTARSFVQMIATCGLIRPRLLRVWGVRSAFHRYAEITGQKKETIHPIWRLRRWQQVPAEKPRGWKPTREDLRLMDDDQVRVVKVRMAGLWDTVGAIGKYCLRDKGAHTQKAAMHNVRPTRSQEYGYHALAIDENRPMFDITLWRTFAEQGKEAATLARYAPYYEQRWFAGAHSDVGGGGNAINPLSDISLDWMMKKSSALGLAFSSTVKPPAKAWLGEVHDSFESFVGGVLTIWEKMLPGDQRNYREMDRAPREVTALDGTPGNLLSINETLDDTVLKRWRDDSTYRPPNLVDYFQRHPEQLPAGTKLAQRSQRVCANAYWNRTGVLLRAGVRYRIAVVPGVGEPLHDAQYAAGSIAGENWNSLAHKAAALIHGKRKDDANWFALIGTVDQQKPWIVRDGEVFTAPASGQLQCYFNDVQMERFYKNNSGWVLLDVEQA